MSTLFLLGGGRNEAAYLRTYWQFVEAATTVQGRRRIAIVIAAAPDADREQLTEFHRAPFEFLEVAKEALPVLFVSREEPLTDARLAEIEPTGVYVAGGVTSHYHDALCSDKSWLAYMSSRNLPYAGYSAGAVILAERAILGGFRLGLLHSVVVVVNNERGEGLDFLGVRDGLGLVPFAVEAHSTQWGTLSRLVHAVGEGLVPSGWAIDEGCMLRIEGDELRVSGINNAYRVRRLAEGSVQVDVFRGGTVRRRADW